MRKGRKVGGREGGLEAAAGDRGDNDEISDAADGTSCAPKLK
jgi:hypothetical protein